MKKSITTTVLLLLVLEVASAEISYDLNKIVEIAMKENATIKRNSIELGTLKRKSDKRWAAIVPSLSAGAGATRTEDSTGFVNSANATLSMTLSASSFSEIGQAWLNYEAGLITGASTAREVELSVRKAFLMILYEQEYVDYLKRTVDTARRQYELTVKNQQEGLVPILDTLSAKVNYQNATLTLASAESSCRNDISALKQTAGIPQAEDVRLIGSLESSLPKKIGGAEGLRPSSSGYALLEKRLEAAQYARRIAGWSVWSPTLSCSVATRNILEGAGASAALSAPGVTVSIGFSVSDLMPWS
ncbi:MAG: TolC family protein, partial [Candidatus Competibacteraceae bacterium]|nr:TolC family protein [Candidatus Competibacteraceae bacterium]